MTEMAGAGEISTDIWASHYNYTYGLPQLHIVFCPWQLVKILSYKQET